MSENIPVSFEELHSTYAQASALAEANAFRTVPTNYYKAQGIKAEAVRKPSDEQFPQGRIIINGKVELFREDKRVGTMGIFLSPNPGRTKTGKFDREFRLYNQLVRALYPDLKSDQDLAAVPASDLLERFQQYPVGMFVTETFASEPDGLTGAKTYQDAKSDEEAKMLRERGWKPNNYVQSIGKFKN